MTKNIRRLLIVVTLIVGLAINGCGASKKNIHFKTEIQNASSLTAYNLDFENGKTKLLLVPLEKYQELEFTIFTLPGTNDRMVLPTTDEDEFVSIPLAEKIDVELSGIKPGTYIFVVNSYHVSKDESIELGPMVLMVEQNGLQGLYGLEIKKDSDVVNFNPGSSFLSVSN